MLRKIIFILLSVSTCLSVVDADERETIVAGYLPNYRTANWSRDIGPVTDLILFGMPVPDDGEFDLESLSQNDIDIARTVKSKTKCRLLFTVGGWKKSSGFPKLANDPKLRRQFILNARRFCLENEFDGIDYDWEHPKGAVQINAFSILLAETHDEFSKHGLLVTLAQAGWQDLGQQAYDVVDRVHLMAYDHNFPQATFEKSKNDVDQLVQYGCPKSKIILGIPFYGRNKHRQAKSFAQLSKHPNFDQDSSIVDGYAFNGRSLIKRKVDFAKNQKLGGIMIWELGQDVGAAQSLLRTIENTLSKSMQ